jgi:hypothetical protein
MEHPYEPSFIQLASALAAGHELPYTLLKSRTVELATRAHDTDLGGVLYKEREHEAQLSMT